MFVEAERFEKLESDKPHTPTETTSLRSLPAPGKVAIDGKTGDWDLSGGIFVCGDVEKRRGTLNDAGDTITDQQRYQKWVLDPLGNCLEMDNNGTLDERVHNEVNEIISREYDDNPRAITHDAFNRRVEKDLETGTDVLYLYDGWRCIEERDWDATVWELRRQYLHGGQYIDELLTFDKDSGTDGELDTLYYYCQQANYNVVAVTSDAGVIVDRIKYDPYGEPTLVVDGSTDNPYLFQGRRLDDETGLYYFRNRYYSPELGRFLQRDPLKLSIPWAQGCSGDACERSDRCLAGRYASGDGSMYPAFGSNPATRQDPTGLWTKGIHKWLTIGMIVNFRFGLHTYEALKDSNVNVDKGKSAEEHMMHYIADEDTDESRAQCRERSKAAITVLTDMAAYLASQCAAVKWEIDLGRSGIILLGTALHSLQDRTAHQCMTEQQHGFYNTPVLAWIVGRSIPWRFWKALAVDKNSDMRGEALLDTIVFGTKYREKLKNEKGMSDEDIKCCVEMPFDLQD